MTKKIYHETFKTCPRSVCFPLLLPLHVCGDHVIEDITLARYMFANPQRGSWRKMFIAG